MSSLIDDSVKRYSVNHVEGRHKDDSYIRLGIGSQRVQVESDTGSRCNILPLIDYN